MAAVLSSPQPILDRTAMRPATKTEVQRPVKVRRPIDAGTIKRGQVVVCRTETTPAKRKSAVTRLLKGMPPAVKPGQKPAHVLLAEYRAGK